MAFYQLSAAVAILPAIALALAMGRDKFESKISVFLSGVGDINIVTMCIIYLLAGGFASVAKAIGGVDATVNLGLAFIPAALVLPGLFAIAAFVATAMGTSMGTIAAIAPIAAGVGQQTDISSAMLMGTVVGGAMFGDNLSMISDTTIAATRTQGCAMSDKFKMNIRIVLPAAIGTILLLGVLGTSGQSAMPGTGSSFAWCRIWSSRTGCCRGQCVCRACLRHCPCRKRRSGRCARLFSAQVFAGYLCRFQWDA